MITMGGLTLGAAMAVRTAPAPAPATANSAGGWQTGTVVRCLGAVGQPFSACFIASSHRLARTGVVLAPLMDPARDADLDGIPDEDSPDDDADGLGDRQEIAGTAFSPAAATDPLRRDTDGDGATDGAEAAAGTDPLDPLALLRIVTVRGTPAGLHLEWSARGGRAYELIASTNAAGLFAGAVAQVVTAGTGTGAWQVVTAAATNAWPSAATFMAVRPQ